GVLPDGGAAYLSDLTLPHVEGVQAGFVGWLRSDSAGIAELRYLLDRVGSIRVDGPTTEAERRAAAAEAAAELDHAARTGRRPAAAPRGADGSPPGGRAARRRAMESRCARPRSSRARDAAAHPGRGRPFPGGSAN